MGSDAGEGKGQRRDQSGRDCANEGKPCGRPPKSVDDRGDQERIVWPRKQRNAEDDPKRQAEQRCRAHSLHADAEQHKQQKQQDAQPHIPYFWDGEEYLRMQQDE